MTGTKKKGGAGIVEALWAGTAVFAAVKAKTYTSLITSIIIYGVILMVVLAAGAWVMNTIGIQVREKMTDIGALPCPPGQSDGVNEAGERVCRGANATYVYPTPSGGLSA